MAVNGQKLLPQGNRGGALAVSRPKVSLVKKEVKKDITFGPDTMLVIKTRVVEIEKILKGSVALDKKIQDQERKEKQKLLRAEEEKELETKDDDADKKVKKKKSKIKLGFLDGLIKFINDVLMGWLLVRMVDFLPQLKKILPLLGGALDFLTSTVLGIVNALGTFLMWGDKAISGSRGFVKNIFGEKGAKAFDAIVGTIGNLFNLIAILGMTAAAFGNQWGDGKKKPKKPKKPKLKNRFKNIKNRLKKFKNRFKNIKPLKRLKNIKPLQKIKNIKPLQRLKNIKPLERLKNIKPLEKLNKIKPTDILKRAKDSKLFKQVKNINIKEGINKFGKDYLAHLKKGAGKPGLFANLKTGAGKLWQGTKKLGSQTVEVTKTVAKKTVQLSKSAIRGINNFAKNTLASVNDVIGGIAEQGKKWAKKIGNIIEEAKNPAKLTKKVKGLLKGKMDKIVKNNNLIKQLKNLNPKDAAKSIKGLLEGAKKNKHILNLKKGLKVAKAAKIGGVDAVIAAIMGVLDYAAFGESPINAILRAIGGLLGYTAGFAIGAPFGGAPGFITGMAGAFVGEWASKKIAQGLAGTKLGEIQDPIMNDGRMLVRDPDNAAMNEELEKEQSKHGLGEDISKEFTIGKKTFDLSKSMGGLSREEYDALSNKDRGILNRRLKFYANRNEGVAKIIPVDVNSVQAISKSASYEDDGQGGTVVIVENSSGTGNQQTESNLVVVGGSSSDDSTTDAFYKGDV